LTFFAFCFLSMMFLTVNSKKKVTSLIYSFPLVSSHVSSFSYSFFSPSRSSSSGFHCRFPPYCTIPRKQQRFYAGTALNRRYFGGKEKGENKSSSPPSTSSASTKSSSTPGTSIYWTKEYQTIPNYITLTRILASPFLTYAVISDMKSAALLGVIAFGFSDWLDGYLAKKLNQQTTIGAFLDPLADKVMIGSLSLGLMWKGLLPVELGLLIVGRDLFLSCFAIALRLIDKPSDAHFWDVRTTSFKVIPHLLSKVRVFCFLLGR
jgi:cardiolipin synthase